MKGATPISILAAGMLLLASMAPCRAEHSSKWIATYQGLLSKYVAGDGVRYAAWKNDAADLQALDDVVDGIAQQKVSRLSKKEQLAFYINAYNAWILHEALVKYPTKTVKDPFYTFFTAKRITVAGEEMSFNHLEKEILRPKFIEPRVHFALNCASRSCPPLYSEPFQGSKIEKQLEDLAVDFINSPKGVIYQAGDGGAALSAIFNWYKDDFREVGGPIHFINERLDTPLTEETKITYQTYDWSLNQAR